MRMATWAVLFVMTGCTVEKAGAPCSGPRTCKPPLECIKVNDRSLCAAGCDSERDPTTGAARRVCKDPETEPSESHTVGGKLIGSAGCLCVPKS